MNHRHLLFGLLIFALPAPYCNADAGDARVLSLEAAVALARDQSPAAVQARHQFTGSYWQYRSFRAGYLPHLSFDAILPDLNRTITSITLPDGSDAFVRRSQAASSANLSLNQTIGMTGGQLFLRSGLQRIDLIRDDRTEISYLSTPVNIGFSQPIFAYNRFKWERQIEPLRYEEAKREYLERLEDISVTACRLFFGLLNAQIDLEISRLNLESNDTLYKISLGRFELGRLAENELLQMELNVLDSEAALEQARLNYEMALMGFRSFFGLGDGHAIRLVMPEEALHDAVDVGVALREARTNRSDMLYNERRRLEAESQVAQAKADSRFNANLFAVYGLTQSAPGLPEAYKDPLNHQQLRIGIQVPLVDWGVSRGRVKMAESNREMVQAMMNQQLTDFEQEVLFRVMEFNLLDRQLEIARRADLIAQRRYDVSRQRFLLGRVDIVELNLAIRERDLAQKRYLSALQNFWSGFYEIRRLTLYDFVNDRPLSLDQDDM
jgi:outer membrane protein